MDTVNTLQVSSDILSEFLEVAIHGILYSRGLYPPGVFDKKKKYNVPVQMCLHPEVTQYITKLVEGVKCLLEQGEVEKVAMVILKEDNSPVERFVFEITDTRGTRRTDQYLFHLEQSLRAFLLKLTVCDALLQPLPDECTWTVHIHTRESAAEKMEEKQSPLTFPWVEADENQQKLVNAKLIPLKAMNSDLFKMQLFVEESGLKSSSS